MWLPFALLAASVVGPFPQPWRVPHQFDEWEAIGYRHKVAELCRTHINNHRARATGRDWHMNKASYKESDYDTSTSTDVCGRWGWGQHLRDRDAERPAHLAVPLPRPVGLLPIRALRREDAARVRQLGTALGSTNLARELAPDRLSGVHRHAADLPALDFPVREADHPRGDGIRRTPGPAPRHTLVAEVDRPHRQVHLPTPRR
jgi:hypothetical protein